MEKSSQLTKFVIFFRGVGRKTTSQMGIENYPIGDQRELFYVDLTLPKGQPLGWNTEVAKPGSLEGDVGTLEQTFLMFDQSFCWGPISHRMVPPQ